MTSPTQRSLRHLRELGFLAAVIERWPYLIAESKPHPHSAGAAKPTPEMNVA